MRKKVFFHATIFGIVAFVCVWGGVQTWNKLSVRKQELLQKKSLEESVDLYSGAIFKSIENAQKAVLKWLNAYRMLDRIGSAGLYTSIFDGLNSVYVFHPQRLEYIKSFQFSRQPLLPLSRLKEMAKSLHQYTWMSPWNIESMERKTQDIYTIFTCEKYLCVASLSFHQILPPLIKDEHDVFIADQKGHTVWFYSKKNHPQVPLETVAQIPSAASVIQGNIFYKKMLEKNFFLCVKSTFSGLHQGYGLLLSFVISFLLVFLYVTTFFKKKPINATPPAYPPTQQTGYILSIGGSLSASLSLSQVALGVLENQYTWDTLVYTPLSETPVPLWRAGLFLEHADAQGPFWVYTHQKLHGPMSKKCLENKIHENIFSLAALCCEQPNYEWKTIQEFLYAHAQNDFVSKRDLEEFKNSFLKIVQEQIQQALKNSPSFSMHQPPQFESTLAKVLENSQNVLENDFLKNPPKDMPPSFSSTTSVSSLELNPADALLSETEILSFNQQQNVEPIVDSEPVEEKPKTKTIYYLKKEATASMPNNLAPPPFKEPVLKAAEGPDLALQPNVESATIYDFQSATKILDGNQLKATSSVQESEVDAATPLLVLIKENKRTSRIA